jgi:2,4-dienoyl-CoA reductase [(3E)-enoyl-CoA-producing], peroxisomal
MCSINSIYQMRHGASAAIIGRKWILLVTVHTTSDFWNDLSEERLKNTTRELSAATGSSCLAVRADVRDPKQVQAAVKQIIERYGRIDFVINGNSPKHTFIYPFPPTTTGFQARQEIFLLPFLASLKTASGL